VQSAIIAHRTEMSGRPSGDLAAVVAVEALRCEARGLPDARWLLPALAWVESGMRPEAVRPAQRGNPRMLGMWQFHEGYLKAVDVRAERWRDVQWAARTACDKLLKWHKVGRGGKAWLRRWFGRGPVAEAAEARVRVRMERLRNHGDS
jgi:hypothetical protein